MADLTGMLAAAAGNAGTETDPNFNQTVLLLHGDGNQGATNFTNVGPPVYLAFKDNSDNDFPITVNGNARGDNSNPFQVGEGEWSNYFNASNDSNIVFASNAAFAIGTGNFTVEFFVNFDEWASTNQLLFLQDVAGTATLQIGRVSGSESLFVVVANATAQIDYSWSPTIGQWYHIAVVRSGTGSNQLALYIDGVSVATGTASGSITQRQVIVGGLDWATSYNTRGYISNLRYSNTARTISVPTSPYTFDGNTLILTCQSNRFVDNSSNGFPITVNGNTAVKPFNPFTTDYNTEYGSGYFDGTGDYLSTADNAVFDFSNGEFTVEAFIYGASGGNKTGSVVFNQSTGSASSNSAFYFGAGTDGISLYLSTSGSSWTNFIETSVAVGNRWGHVVWQRRGDTLEIYLDGVLQTVTSGSSSFSGTVFNSSRLVEIGAQNVSGSNYQGYISNLRVVKGSAVYTGNFTPPTAPLTTVSGTEFLTCQYAGTVRNIGFIDSSPYDFPITLYGNTTQGTFSPFSLPDGRWSNYFDGTGDAVRASASSLSMSSFTIESWINYSGDANIRAIFDFVNAINGYGVLAVYSNSISSIRFQFFSTNSVGSLIGNIDVVWTSYFNKWVHLACTYDGSTYRVFVNGTIAGTLSSATPVVAINSLTIGGRGDPTPSQIWQGYISNMRFVTGAALYTSDFTPPTSPLTTAGSGTTQFIFAQSNRFVDTEGNYTFTLYGNPKVTPFSPFAPTAAYDPAVNGGSGYFDGTGDYLTAGTNAAFAFGTGDFTVEGWVYAPAFSDFNVWYDGRLSGGDASGIVFSFNASGNVIAYSATSNLIVAGPISANSWNHIAFVRSGTTLTAYINGVSSGTPATVSTDFTSNNSVIGKTNESASNYFNGYIFNLRVVKGTAVYTGSFTPPTAPLTTSGSASASAYPSTTNINTSFSANNTSLLLNFTNAGIFDNTGKNVLETVGNAQVDTSTVKFGTGSMKFDGSGDYLIMPVSENLQLGTGDFTVEFWMNSSITPSGWPVIVGNITTTSGTWRIGNAFNGANEILWTWYTTGYNDLRIAFNPNDGNWHHVAAVRSSGTLSIYIDGVFRNSTTVTTDLSSSVPVRIAHETVTPNFYNGYIDDLRITKGVARYTSDFTVPDKAFPDL